jgi:hypothetical protein
MERLTPSTDDHDISGQIDISAHGTDGPLAISLPNYPLLLDDMVMKATHELSVRYPFNKDLNTGNVIGIGTFLSGLVKCPFFDMCRVRLQPSGH